MKYEQRVQVRAGALALLVVAFLGGCERFGGARVVGSGDSKTEAREVATFHELKLSGAYTVELTTGSLTPVSITADDNILPLISTEVRGGRLVIDLMEKVRPKTGIVVTASVPDIRRIVGEGAGRIKVTGVKNDKLVVELAGGYELRATGETGDLSLSVTGAGDIDTTELSANTAKVSITGAGSIDVQARDSLDAQITGAGSIRYTGDPKVTKQILGAGTVRKK